MSKEKSDNVRVRFAPSPTGYLHIGGARTAIFNWLFARHHQGKFLLRIEDTDFARSDTKMVQAIYDGLKWLGLDWDEEPIFQSQRLDQYQQVAQQLSDSGKAYFCYCSREKLDQQRNTDNEGERTFRYDGHCRKLSASERNRLEAEGSPKVLRFKVETGKTYFSDEVHGSLTIDNSEIDDFVILRSDGIPTYNFAVVVDDHDMVISHVIRGDDHLSNTPKQVMIYKALEWEMPKFAHVPLILGPDKKRLSKRHGATSVSEYEAMGYLPEAMLNFLSLLGWSPGDDREVMTKQELIEAFRLKGISKKSAVFDEAKLIWMNGEYISRMSDDELFHQVVPILLEKQVIAENEFSEAHIKKALSLLKPKIKKLTDFANLGFYFFKDPEQYEAEAVKKYWHDESIANRLKAAEERLSGLVEFDAEKIETELRNLAEGSSLSAARFIHPIRLALTGFAVSPGLFELMEILGKDVVIKRINKAIIWLTEHVTSNS